MISTFLFFLTLLVTAPKWFWFSLPLGSWQLVLIAIVALGFFITRPSKLAKRLVIVFALIRLVVFFLPPLPMADLCIRLHQLPCMQTQTSTVNYNFRNFPLYGFNQNEFNLLGEEAQRRPYLPFQIEFRLPTTSDLSIESSPALDQVGDLYLFSSTNNNPQNKLSVGLVSMFGFKTSDFGWLNLSYKLLTILINSVALILVISLVTLLYAPIIKQLNFTHLYLLFPLLVSIRGTFLPFEILFAATWTLAKNGAAKIVLLVSVLIFSFFASTRLVCPTCVELLPSGSDTLTYESYARTISEGPLQFWSAGEPKAIFYYTPLYRYFLAAFHFIGGESLWGPHYLTTVLYFLTVICILGINKHFFGKYIALLTGISIAFLNKLPQLGLLFVFNNFYTESVGIFLLFLSLFLIIVPKRKYLFLIGLSFGLSVAVRPNYLPALLPLSLLAFNHRSLKEIPKLYLGLLVSVLFIMLRNYIVVGKLQYFSTSAASTLAIGLVDLLYHGQKAGAPGGLYLEIVRQFLKDPISVLIPLWNNFRIMIGLPSMLPQSISYLPTYRPIPNAFVYLPIWILGIIGIISRFRKFTKEFVYYGIVFLIIFVTNLPFGVYFNGSAKYYIYVLFLTPFFFQTIFSITKAAIRITGYIIGKL